jgi:hypothetical protein
MSKALSGSVVERASYLRQESQPANPPLARHQDRKLAERRLADFKARTSDLANGPDANTTFGVLARHWLDVNRHAMSAGTAKRKTQYIEGLEPFFNGTALRHIRPAHCERWVPERGAHLSSSSFNHEFGLVKAVFEFSDVGG